MSKKVTKLKPVEKAEVNARIDTAEIGRTGLRQYNGVISEEGLPRLQSDSIKREVYREMLDNDATISAILFAIDMLIRNVSWTVQSASEEQEAEEAKQFVEECLDDMSNSWEDLISEILSFLPWGWSYFELVYKYRNGQSKDPSKRSKYDDGKIGWRKIALRGQDSLQNWIFDEEGGISAMVQSPPPDYMSREIPIEKALLFRTSSYKGNPEGKSLLRNVYRSWYFKKRIESIEAMGIERDLTGVPVVYVPSAWTDPRATAGQQAAYADAKLLVTNMKRDEQEGVVLPYITDENGNQTLKLELLTTGGRRQFDVDKIIQRYDQRIAMTVLADFILLGSESVGSFALSSDKTDLFGTALGSWTKMIASVFNRHAIPRLMTLNGIDLEHCPALVPGDIETPDLASLGEYINKLTGAGIDLTRDLDLENYLREAGGLPLKPEDFEYEEEVVEPQKDTLIEAVNEMKETVKKAIENDVKKNIAKHGEHDQKSHGGGGEKDDAKTLESLNPTGTIFTDNKAQEIDKMPLGENITTYDKTANLKADDIVVVYRGVPNNINEIKSGDFITTNKQLAKDYAGDGKIISREVRADEILDDKTEPLGEEYILREKT